MKQLFCTLLARQGDLAVFMLAVVLTAAAFSPTDEPEAYLFPRLSAAAMLLFATVNLIRLYIKDAAASSPATTHSPLPLTVIKQLAPAIAALFAFLTVAETLGFYLSSAVLFYFLVWFYGPRPQRNTRRALVKTAVWTAVFIAALYALFSLLLVVQLPAFRLSL